MLLCPVASSYPQDPAEAALAMSRGLIDISGSSLLLQFNDLASLSLTLLDKGGCVP